MLPFGLSDTIFSTVDYKCLARSVWMYGSLTVKELMQGKL
jgi:hypothetical protein